MGGVVYVYAVWLLQPQKTDIWLTLNGNKKVTPQVMGFIRRNIRQVNKWPTFLMKPRENKKNYRTRIKETTNIFMSKAS